MIEVYCTYCGKQIEDNANFCCYCGKQINNVKSVNNNHDVKGKVFSFIGFGLGITAFVFSLIPIWCFCAFCFTIPAMIFSNLGRNSTKANFARKGKVFGILSIIFSVIMSIVTMIILGYILNNY